MPTITAVMFQSCAASAPHPVLAIDGISLEVWLGSVRPEANSLGLVPAQGWLIDDDEFRCAWDRIESLEAGVSTVVPVLVCGDDVDLSCTVVVVEQVVSQESVTWQRFGFSRTAGRETGISTEWFFGVSPVTFSREEFSSALTAFKSLANTAWK